VCIYIYANTADYILYYMTLYMYTVRAADSPGPGCVRERRQWRRQNGNYVQRRVSGTRTFGRHAARARVLSVCVRTRSRPSVGVRLCVDKHFKGSSPLHPFSRWPLKCVYTHINIYIHIYYIRTPPPTRGGRVLSG